MDPVLPRALVAEPPRGVFTCTTEGCIEPSQKGAAWRHRALLPPRSARSPNPANSNWPLAPLSGFGCPLASIPLPSRYMIPVDRGLGMRREGGWLRGANKLDLPYQAMQRRTVALPLPCFPVFDACRSSWQRCWACHHLKASQLRVWSLGSQIGEWNQ